MKKLCLMLAVLLMISGCSKKETEDNREIIDVKETVERKDGKVNVTHIENDKQETVYAKADAYGNITSSEVEVVLKSEGSEPIEDVTELSDIRNMVGDETFTLNGNELVFENKGEDIHYKGKSDKTLPVTLKITYYLNDSEIKAEELKGKSGKLKMRFDYQNNTADASGMITPFVAVTVVSLDSDVFSNVKVENGRLLEYGDTRMAVINVNPGLSNALKLNEYKLTEKVEMKEYGEITADVNNFKLDFTATVVSNGIFKEIADGDINDLSEFADKTADFKSESSKLTDNTSQLYNACSQFSSSLAQYVNGVKELDSNVSKLTEGTSSLQEALASMEKMLEDYPDVGTIVNTLTALAEKRQTIAQSVTGGVQNIYQNLILLENKVSTLEMEEADKEELLGYINNSKKEAEALSTADFRGFETLMGDLQKQLTALGNAVGFKDTVVALNQGAQQLNDAVKAFKEGTAKLAASGDALNSGSSALVKAASGFDNAMRDLVNNELDDMTSLGGSSLQNVINRIKNLKSNDAAYGCFSGLKDGKSGKSVIIIETEGI